MASFQDLNPFKVKDRVVFKNEEHFLNKCKGTVKFVNGVSVDVVVDGDNMEIITSYKNLKKLKKK